MYIYINISISTIKLIWITDLHLHKSSLYEFEELSNRIVHATELRCFNDRLVIGGDIFDTHDRISVVCQLAFSNALPRWLRVFSSVILIVGNYDRSSSASLCIKD